MKFFKFIKKNIGIEDIIIASLSIYLIYLFKQQYVKIERMSEPLLHEGITYKVSSIWGSNAAHLKSHFTPWIDSTQGWSSKLNDKNQTIEMSFKRQIVKNLKIQGRIDGAHGQYVKKYHLYYKLDSPTDDKWISLGEHTSETKNNDIHINPVNGGPNERGVITTAIKLEIVEWHNHITMRVGLDLAPAPTPTILPDPAQEPAQEPADQPADQPAVQEAQPAPKKSSSKAPIFIILFLLLGVGAFIFIKKRKSKKN